MSYRERQRLADIQAAIDAIRCHLQRGDLSDGLIFDAVRIRLLEIGNPFKISNCLGCLVVLVGRCFHHLADESGPIV
jgi:hypothetical protein